MNPQEELITFPGIFQRQNPAHQPSHIKGCTKMRFPFYRNPSNNSFEFLGWAAAVIKHPLVRGKSAVAGLVMLSMVSIVGAADVQGSGTSGATFMPAPEGARLIKIRLSVPDNSGTGQQNYLAQRSPQPLEETTSLPPSIAAVYAGKEFSAYLIASMPNGTSYLVVLGEDKNVKFLNRNEAAMLYARVYRATGGSDPKVELLREGFQSPGNDVTLPVELEVPGIGSTKVKSIRTLVGYSVEGSQNGKPMVHSGRGLAMTVTGSQITTEGKLTLTVTVPEDAVINAEMPVTLKFEPLTPGLPERIASGKTSDFLTLASTRFAVTEVAPDFSSATLAVVAGSLEQTLKQELRLGTRMPPFLQVDLASRRAITREEVLSRVEGAHTVGVIFVFGDLPSAGSQYGGQYVPSAGGVASMTLPLPAAEVVEQLGLDQEKKPLVVFVTRQISIEFLYRDLRNKTPEYLVLTDYIDPLRTIFRVPQNTGGWYGPPYSGGPESTLRQMFNLPDRLCIAAFDAGGKVVYTKADSSTNFLVSLAEARAALKAP